MDTTPADELDVESATIEELRAEYDALTDQIEELAAEPETLQVRNATNLLKIRRNDVVRAVNALVAASTVDDEPIIEPTPEAEADAPAEVAEAVEAPAEPVADEEVVDTEAVEAEAAQEEVVAGTDAPIEADTDTQIDEVDTAATPVAEEDDLTEPAEAPAAEADAPVVEDTTPVAETAPEPTVEAVEPGVIDAIPTTTSTTEDFTVDTQTGSNDLPSADGAAVVEAAETILAGAELVGAHTAAARPISGPEDTARPQVGWIADGGQQKFAQGMPINYSQIGDVMNSVRTRRVTPTSGPMEGVIASLPSFESTQDLGVDVLSNRNVAERNTSLITEAVAAWRDAREGRLARTAAVCSPLDIIREIPRCGVAATPFADLFPQRPIARLGFQYIPQMALSAVADGVTVWTETNQNNIDDDDSSTWKPVVDIDCADPVEVKAEEITAGARVDNATEMSQSEHVEEFLHKLTVQRARRREQYLLSEFDSGASAYTFTGSYGPLTALLEAGLALMPQLVYGERLDEGDYDLVLEPGHLQKLINDENSRIYGDTLAVRRASIINKIKDDLGVMNVVVLRDFRTGGFAFQSPNPAGDAADALRTLPDANRVRFVPSGAYLYGSTGEQSTGWATDPQLARQNRTQWFSKEWVALAKHGCNPAAYVDLLASKQGARSNGITTVDTTSTAS